MPSPRSFARRTAAPLLDHPSRLDVVLSRPITDSLAFGLVRQTEFQPIQRRREIALLCGALRSSRASSLLEIGTSRGGTALLLSRALARPGHITTVDIEQRYDAGRLRAAIPSGVGLDLVVGDSTGDVPFERARAALPSGYDVVFIDGDHSYEGVRHDTLHYAPLARPGGILVFHDVQDADPTSAPTQPVYVGGVPTWWRQIEQLVGVIATTFVDDPAQSGFGIGVIELPGSRTALDELLQRFAHLDHPAGI